MLKVVEGIYKDGNVAVKVDELPADVAGTTPFVFFVKNDIEMEFLRKLKSRLELASKLASGAYDESENHEISERELDDLSNALKVSDETNQKPFISVMVCTFYNQKCNPADMMR